VLTRVMVIWVVVCVSRIVPAGMCASVCTLTLSVGGRMVDAWQSATTRAGTVLLSMAVRASSSTVCSVSGCIGRLIHVKAFVIKSTSEPSVAP
jgi:hypothetical protein